MSPEDRLRELGIVLPESYVPRYSYVPAVRAGNLLFVSGHNFGKAATRDWKGKVGSEFTVEEGRQAAREIGINILATLKHELGSLARVARVVKVLGFVASAPGFGQQPLVMNGFSDLMQSVFGEAGRHARSAIGVNELPNDIPVEIEAVFELS